MVNNSQLDQWCKFCEGKISVDVSSFLTLFHSSFTDEELEEIFKYFSCSGELISRVKKVELAKSKRCETSITANKELCLKLATKDLSERIKASKSIGDIELLNVALNAEREFTTDFSTIVSLQNNDWNISLLENTGDYFNSRMISRDAHYYAIFEAFYGMTTLFPIKWYLCSPLSGTDIDFSYFLKLWEIRGDYTLTEKSLLVSQDITR